jgi:penicillin-binding protein 1B
MKVPRGSAGQWLARAWVRWLLAIAAMLVLTAAGITSYFYLKYVKEIEEKLAGGPFARTSKLFAAPREVRVGDAVTADELMAELRRSGYSDRQNSLMGWYHERPDALEIFPGPDSYFRQDPFLLKFRDGQVSQIMSLRDNSWRSVYQMEPELVTNLFDRQRQKRRLVRYEDLPKRLVEAVVSVEDKRFFKHAGFDPLRIVKAAWVDVQKGYHAQGASTLSMQLARGLWLTPEKTWKRKAAEALVTLHLERTLTKQQIFEYYANNVDLGRRGSFSILGFGEAAQAYFGRNVRDLTLAEAATLAGHIQRPSYTNPVRWPERAKARRNIVLSLMRENGYISEAEYAEAAAQPLSVASGSVDSNDAPYYVDLVNDWLQDQMAEHDFQSRTYRVFTTLDPRLQRDAMDAIRAGIKEADDLLEKRRKRVKNVPEAQVALVALDARTGEVRALAGGRNYGLSQLNRAVAKRQPGSIFKPFVYAAALNTAIDPDARTVLTPTTMLMDEPTKFVFDDKEYEPGNFGDKFYGNVSLRFALSKSLNIPTVKAAEMVGYDKVADLAKKSGLPNQVATPSIALGSYDATPIEMAGAYTPFANDGTYIKPVMVKAIYDQTGAPLYEAKSEKRKVLDPRVNYLMVNMLEEVVRSGTGAGIRSRGFLLPAAGKTGTSRDGWFAGFTSKLICIVWVGFDNNDDLKLEGAKSALPIWTEFMKRAHEHREYKRVQPFAPPEGVVVMDGCSGGREAYIAGSEPRESCGGATQVAAFGADEEEPAAGAAPTAAPADRAPAARRQTARAQQSIPVKPADGAKPAAQPESKGLWSRIRDIFK